MSLLKKELKIGAILRHEKNNVKFLARTAKFLIHDCALIRGERTAN